MVLLKRSFHIIYEPNLKKSIPECTNLGQSDNRTMRGEKFVTYHISKKLPCVKLAQICRLGCLRDDKK